MFRHTVTRVLAGLMIGVIAALGLSPVLTSLLYGVAPGDVFTFASVAVSLAAVGLAACLIPAWQALRVDPMAALRKG